MWAYAVVLLVLLIIQANRGNYVWQRSVKESFPAIGGVPPAGTTAPGVFEEGKPQQPAGQYGYPPSTVSPQLTGYSQPQQPAQPYPQV